MKFVNYILDEAHQIIECTDVLKWADWMQTHPRHVAYEMIGDVCISTVFLGIDHSFFGGRPLLFETMVFGGQLDQEQERCSTWTEAEEMHWMMVERVRRIKLRS